MEVGQKIVFDLESWPDGGDMIMLEVTSEILGFCHDPIKRHESKCNVVVNEINYGIPFSQVKKVLPKTN
jgi:hypothetical protein